MAERGLQEDNILWGYGKSLGFIEIRDSPIWWLNICKKSKILGESPDRKLRI
jgi:hypothetical protein